MKRREAQARVYLKITESMKKCRNYSLFLGFLIIKESEMLWGQDFSTVQKLFEKISSNIWKP